MTQPTPTPIREAAKETNPYHPVSKDNYSVFECGFIAGATHSETEKYYRDEIEQCMQWAMLNGYNISTNGREILFTNVNRIITYFPALLQLYRESQTDKNK